MYDCCSAGKQIWFTSILSLVSTLHAIFIDAKDFLGYGKNFHESVAFKVMSYVSNKFYREPVEHVLHGM